jgi:RimJ/RimL family protein N-acetyltransferase
MKPNPILLDVPAEIRTERLLLRAPRAGDGSLVFPQVKASLIELKQWMPWAKDDYAEKDAEEWCRKSAANFLAREMFQFLIFHGESHIGNIGVFKFNWDVPSCEIGYWLDTRQTGNGFMTEAVHGVTRLAADTLKAARIQILTDESNSRSWRVAERCGYQLEGILHNDSRTTDGKLRNTRVYSKITSQ